MLAAPRSTSATPANEDPSTGLFQNWHRDYDPTLGRYAEADPLGLGGGGNLFAYARGNPINMVDRDGRIALNTLTGFIGGAVGGGGNLLGQLYRNGGRWHCVDWSDVLISGAFGFASGFVAPFAAPGIVGAIGLGGLTGIGQTGASNWANGVPTTPQDVFEAGAIGGVTGGLSGGVGRPPSGSASDLISDTGDVALDRAMNEFDRIRNATAADNFLRDFLLGTIGN